MLKVICTYTIRHKVANRSILKQTRNTFIHTTPIQMKDNFFKTLINTYVNGIKKVEKVFEKIAPGPMKVYYAFREGMQKFYGEMQESIQLLRDEKSVDYDLRQLMLTYQVQKDITKLFPIMIVGFLPFGLFFVVPLTYFFPYVFLTRHFLSDEQKKNAAYFQLKKRLLHSDFIYKRMISVVHSLKSRSLGCDLEEVIDHLDKGQDPDVSLIVKCTHLFQRGQPFSMQALPFSYRFQLSLMNGLLFDITGGKLVKLAKFIVSCDRAILRDNPELSEDMIKELCLQRGFNAIDVSIEEAREALNNWLKLSQHLNENNYSLVFHAPILLWRNRSGQNFRSLKIK